MKKNTLLFIVLVLLVLGVAFVFGGAVPEGSSYHEHLYTKVISGADQGNVVVNDRLDADGGLVIDVCSANVAGDCPTAATAVEGQMWLVTSSQSNPNT